MARGDGRIYRMQNTPFYHCAFFLRGTEYRMSTKCTDPKEAQKFLRNIIKEKNADEIGAKKMTTPQAARLLVRDLVKDLEEDYAVRGKMSPQTACHFRRLDRDFGHFKAIALTSQDVKSYIARCLAKNQKNSTINRTLGMLNQSYTVAMRERDFPSKPFITKLSEADNVREELYSEAQFQAIVSNLKEEVIQDLAIFCNAVGSRRGESLKLEWNCEHGDIWRLPACSTKTKVPRNIAMVTPELKGVRDHRFAARTCTWKGVVQTSPWIFSRFNPKKGCFEPIKYFWKQWKGAVRAAGLPAGKGQGWFHTLRKDAVTLGLEAGNDPHVIMLQTGHATDSMLRRYNLINPESLRKAQEKTAAYRATLSKELPATNVIAMKTAQK
jgi:integrase